MRIAIGSDHAGFALKQRLKRELESLGLEVIDHGAHSTEPSDYPDYVFPVAEMVARGLAERGVVLGGSGNGECLAANKVAGIRATLIYSEEIARLARAHNDANVFAAGGRFSDPEQAAGWLRVWLDTPFEGGRHVARLEKIRSYELANHVTTTP